jgi:hypothetical protein
MRTLTFLLLLLAPMAGCRQHALSAADFAVPHDLGADLSAPFTQDLGMSCAGTRIAGTCVERFFQPFMACFAPGGSCASFGRGSICWGNGATYELFYPGLSSSWTMNGQACLQWNEYPDGPTYRQQFCTSESSPCTIEHSIDDGGLYHYSAVGGGLYDSDTGMFICPDGTQVDVGYDFSACRALSELLHPQCNQSGGSCH